MKVGQSEKSELFSVTNGAISLKVINSLTITVLKFCGSRLGI